MVTPPRVGDSGGLAQWRERMFFFTLGPGLLLGLLAYLMALPMLFSEGHYLVLTLDSVMLALALTVFGLRRLPLAARVAVLLLMIYCLGLAIMVTIGPLSSGPFWLFSIPILAALYLGRRPVLVGLALNLATLLVCTWCFHAGQVAWAESLAQYQDHWLVIVANFLLINAAIALPGAILVHGLETSLGRQRSAAQELARERALLRQEMTNRRQAQEAQAESERLYRLVAENVSDSIWIVRLKDMALTYASPSVQALLGYNPGQAMSLGLPGLLTSQALAQLQQLLTDEMKLDSDHPDPNRSRTLISEGIKSDGDKVWLEVTGRFLRGQDGKPEAILGIARDITERRRAEEALRRSEQRYRDLFDSITDMIYTQDLQGRFTSANQATATIFGYQPGELIGRKGADFMLPEHRQAFESEYLATLKRDGFVGGLSQYLDKRGKRRYLEYRSTLVRPEEGEPYISGSGRDVTERVLASQRLKQLESQLLQSQKMEAVGTLAGGIAHDFNNVLAAMLGYTELVLADLPPDSPIRPNLAQVMKAGERAKGMVRHILSFSRHSESGQAPVRLQPLVTEALELLRNSLPATIQMESHLAAPHEMVMADPSQVHQVVMNLATNAFQAMGHRGGVLGVRLEPLDLDQEQAAGFAELKPGPYLRLRVSDTGQGMTPQTMQRAFEPFFTTKDKSQGSGMGLAMVHGIVKSHGGEVTVKSQPGRGSVFEVYLPRLVNVPEPSPADEEQAGQDGRGERVLLVDDEEAVGRMVRKLLERLGYRVTLCFSGREALKALESAPGGYDLIITDLTMPHLTGDELARRVYEINPGLPVIIATGYGGHLPHGELPTNVRLLLSKPFSGREIALAARRSLEPGRGR
ncbi:MAG: PAS domain S-box protein [Proteobacteria bacterium]|nr:PAS domain S-box protein [Pseudomonadota bacterium]